MEEKKSFFEKLGNSLRIEDNKPATTLAEQSVERKDYMEEETTTEPQEEEAPQELPQKEEMPDNGEGTESVEEENGEENAIEEEMKETSEEPSATLAAATATKRHRTTSKKTKKGGAPEGRLTVDVYETTKEIVVKSTIAGVDKENLDIEVTSDSITIRGIREKDEKVTTDSYFYQECYWGVFSRSIILPTEIDPDKAKASLKNGILTVRLPKLTKSEQRKLKVHSD